MNNQYATRWEKTKGLIFHFFPHHYVSRATYWLTRQKLPLLDTLIKLFIKVFNVNLQDAKIKNLSEFETFNAFFTRELEPDARPIDIDEQAIISPCDGKISQFGQIEQHSLIQAKGKNFTLNEFLTPNCQHIEYFKDGNFCTIYLSPRDYHRVHMAYDAQLMEMIYVPGRLFSVAPYAPKAIDKLYARNERVVCIFKTQHGYMASVMVGAVNVAAIDTVWAGPVTPPHLDHVISYNYQDQSIQLKKGDLMGTFNMGSTVVMMYSKDFGKAIDSLSCEQKVLMGEKIANV
jgi:phosphatidylserine decarboxylase